MKKNNVQNEAQNWKIVRNRACIRAMLIFLGILFMQVIAYMICAVSVMGYAMFNGKDAVLAFSNMAGSKMSGVFVMWISFVSSLLSAVWCGILYKKSTWREEQFDYRKAFSLKNLLAVCGTGVGGCLVLSMLLSFLAMLFPQWFISYNTMMEGLTDSSVLITVIYVLIAGPVSEELIFRGAILDRFYLAFPFWVANILQAVFFGLYHMNLIQGLYAFCLGFVLGMIRHVTGSILASILAHILFNATSYGLDFLFPASEEFLLFPMLGGLIVGFVFLFFGLSYFWKRYRIRESGE